MSVVIVTLRIEHPTMTIGAVAQWAETTVEKMNKAPNMKAKVEAVTMK